jgi:hypothetical protein
MSQEEDTSKNSYLIPQTIFVGDRGRLVIPLGPSFAGAEPFIRFSPDAENRAASPLDLVITRIELEQRAGNSALPARLLIDFIPYAPGRLLFPAITIPASPEPLAVSGFSVTVASILKPQEASLAESAAPLAAPGTGLIIYGSSAAILVLLIVCICGALWGRRHFSYFREHFRRRRLLRTMERFLKHIKVESSAGGTGHQVELFSLLSGEFREFLSLFTGENCRVLTPGEFRHFTLFKMEDMPENLPDVLKGDYIADLFHRWELLRFSGSPVGQNDVLLAMEELRSFIGALFLAEHAAGKARARSGFSLAAERNPAFTQTLNDGGPA